MKKKIIILGSTGSIGKTLIKILKVNKKNIEICVLSANKNYKELLKQAKIFNVKNIIITDKITFLKVKKILKNKKIKIFNDFTCFKNIFKSSKVDYTMSAISGLNGLKPTLNVIKFTKEIALANKESIICGWPLILKNLENYRTKFIPVDSEHFSILSLIDSDINKIEKIFITASGGPFNNYPLKKFKSISPKLALNHPNWKMRKKITIDSATMMNKVFEIIEAKKIFNLDYNQLEILIHPKSYLHAIVKFNNGISKILVHDTSMIIPIFNSIYFGTNNKLKSKSINIDALNNLDLTKVNDIRFPVMKILHKMNEKDSLFETIIVSANDKLVSLFLNKKIKFIDISKILIKICNLREFDKFKLIKPKKIHEINDLADYVSLKIDTMSI